MVRPFKMPSMISESQALPGRIDPMPLLAPHHVFGHPLRGAFEGLPRAWFALGCFWGAERVFWQLGGVVSTAVGYQGGVTPNPTYQEVCSGLTGHTESVQVVFDPSQISYTALLARFWEAHDPTQGYRQGNDWGTQYRSAVFAADSAHHQAAERSRDAFQHILTEAGFGPITTEIKVASPFYYAEIEHQQYLSKNPTGYCGLGGLGLNCNR